MSRIPIKVRTSTGAKIWILLTSAQRKSALVILGLMGISMVLEILGIGLVIPVIALLVQDDLAASYPKVQPVLQMLGNPTKVQLVTGGMLALVGIYLLKNTFLAYFTWRKICFATDVQIQLAQRLFTIYLRQPYTFHLQRNSAQLIRNVTTEVGVFQITLLQLMMLLSEGLVIVGITALLLMAEPVGALIVVLVLGVAAWSYQHFTRRHLLRWGKLRRYHAGLSIQHLMQGLGSAKDVKLLGREDDFLAQYLIHNTQHGRIGRYKSTLAALPRLWLELLTVTGLATLVLTLLAQGRDAASIMPTLGLFAVAAFRLMPSVNQILGSFQAIRFSLPAIDPMYEELQLAAPRPATRTKHAPPLQTKIQLFNVSFTYPNAPAPALNSLSLTIQKGETVGFIGPSGAGKSTLVDVILGLFTPNSGRITVDGQDIQQNLRAWQDWIGYVPQSVYLTDDTLRRNVAFGLPNEKIDEAAVTHAIQFAQLEEFVASLPQGLEALVGERGIRLSGGQRQRIGIARALYHDPAVLVLDEATSSLDTTTESEVMQAITALQGSKTILIVAHRVSTVAHSDRVYRLEQGKLVKEGNPDAMLHQQSQLMTQAQTT
ncbi:MAG TPA: ABC transporter ATP-binding protein [Nitrospirales bacterium]|nr:ABC transporter ATP-binding protein [Nitrospirales bacterium]